MYSLTIKEIRSLAGAVAFKRGEAFYHQGKVHLQSPDEGYHYEAVVSDNEEYQVKVKFDRDNKGFEADCSCPAYWGYYSHCKHMAAVLLNIYDLQKMDRQLADHSPYPSSSLQHFTANSPVTAKDIRLTSRLIALFDESAKVERVTRQQGPVGMSRDELQVEFICRITEQESQDPKIKLELKIGIKRLYVVQNLKQFLEHVADAQVMPFTKLFTYDPDQMVFRKKDRAVIDMLTQISESESVYEGTSPSYAGDRLITIPPLAWEQLQSLLIEAGALIEINHGHAQQLQMSEGRLPISFEINSASEEAYRLDIHGLNDVTIMSAYGIAISGGELYHLKRRELHMLSEMKSLLTRYDQPYMNIMPDQMDSLMQRVVPGLRGIGKVGIDSSIRDRLVQSELVAKVYLDRDEEFVFARVEFIYDGIVIQPLGSEEVRKREEDMILVRDVDKERRILELLESADFTLHGREMVMDLSEEDSIYTMLFHLLPELEKLCEVFATPAVRGMVHDIRHAPKIKADTDRTMNWLEINFEMEGVSEKEIQKILLTIAEKKKYYRMPSGAYLSLEKESYEIFGQLVEELGLSSTDIHGSHMQLPVVRGLQLVHPDGSLRGVQLGKSLRQLIDHMRHPEHMEFEVPSQLAYILRDYQKEGFLWLKTLGSYRFGGILADDMGLGKTVQSIAYILSEKKEPHYSGDPVLIVAPASLVYNWENELHRFAPELKVEVAVGTKQERTEMLTRCASRDSGVAAATDVIITSYPSLRQDIDLYQPMIFSTLFLDEAQAIKNHHSLSAQVVRDLTAVRRFALTGTPIENSIEELWAIFDAIFPGLFSSKKSFRDIPREKISRIVKPFIMRRMKTDVLGELPERIESVQHSELSLDQKKIYSAYLAELQQETDRNLQLEGFQKSRMKILAGITRLRQLCCHPSLFIDDYEGSSGKLEQLLEVVEDCLSSGKRILIFSQFTSMLQLIRGELADLGLPVFYLDGQTPSRERVQMCTRFNAGENNIFLISLKAGGTGLNLTGADTVILYDMWWNPAVEEQAVGRAHRMGQKNVVQVLRLVAKGTIEEKMLELQQRKKDLIQEVIEPGEATATTLTEQEIRQLLMI